MKDLVLVGGGHSHVAVVRRFGMKPLPGLRVTLISPESYTPYSGMLPGLIAGHYTFEESHIDLVRLCRFAGARFFRARVTGLDPDGNRVECEGRPAVPYDLLSINSGSTPDPANVPGAAGRVLPVKPVSEFLHRWEELKQRVLEAPARRIGIVGGGAGGVEMALSAQFALKALLAAHGTDTQPAFHLVTAEAEILQSHNEGVRATFAKVLAARGVALHTDFPVDRVAAAGVESRGRVLPLDEILWATGAQSPDWIRDSGLAKDDRGFIAVDRTLRSTSHPNVFAAGDAATMIHAPRPKSGVFAVRQAGPLADNLRSAALDRPLRPFTPQSAFLSLISTGDPHAVASRGRLHARGAWVWRVKDWIDRRFMEKFNDLPAMEPPAPSAWRRNPGIASADLDALGDLDMRCGGCGAKVGAQTLSRALQSIRPGRFGHIVLGLDAPDDAAIFSVPAGKAIVQSVDSFRAMVDDPHLFGRIAANHALGDIYAMGGDPRWAMALATLPAGLAAKTEATLIQMMAGAVDVLNEARCSLVGGHTSEGSELVMGFSVSGLIDPDTAMRKGGAGPGEIVILTKPLGTGTLFAADMRARAKGRWVERAVEMATQSNRDAGRILRDHGATACTDVTGFGLAGHFFEMLVASGVDGELRLEALPSIDGALETIRAGIVSSLQAENRRGAASIEASLKDPKDPRWELLFDPQTAGGLLACLPEAETDRCIAALHAAGYCQAACIGRILEMADADPRMRLV